MSEVYALEAQLAEAKENMARRDLALQLYNNPAFKKLILEEFCVKDCARYAQQSADPALTDRQRADALALAQAAGHLRRFLSVTVVMGNNGEHAQEALEQEIIAARQEEDATQAGDPQ